MEKLIDWIKDSEKYEFCMSYGVGEMPKLEFVERQDDFYISLLGILHHCLKRYMEAGGKDMEVKRGMLHIAKGLIVYSQKETEREFYGVRRMNNKLYVASLFYLCDYPAVSSWVLGAIDLDDYEEPAARMLAFIVSGGNVTGDFTKRTDDEPTLEYFTHFVLTGDDGALEYIRDYYLKKDENRNFESPTDFYMTRVLNCVLLKFGESNIWHSLRRADGNVSWERYAHHAYSQHVFSFLPSQQDAIDKGLLTFTGAFSLKMPTSAGKSYLTELLIYHELQLNPDAKVLYLAPLRALSRELKDRFRKIHEGLGISFATKYGGNVGSVAEDDIANAQLLIATPESFMAIESFDDTMLNGFTLVICDEGQLLDDYSRGINYEMLLTRLRKQEDIKFLFISAIVPNIEVVNRWLNGTDDHIGNSTYRPSRIVLAEAMAEKGKADLRIYDESNNRISFVVPAFIEKKEGEKDDFVVFDKRKNRWKVNAQPVCCHLALQSLSAGSVLLFTTGKTSGISCVSLAKKIIEMSNTDNSLSPINFVINKSYLEDLIEYAAFILGSDHLLCEALRNGFVFHHGDIPQSLREKIERAYGRGLIRLIISNNTLAEGVNLPIKTIVLANVVDPSGLGNYLPNNRLKNIIGRVGRAGRERYGTVMIPAIHNNSLLLRMVKEALSNDDSDIQKMTGTLYSLIEYLVNNGFVKNQTNIDELLSDQVFADAIDDMIVRSDNEEGTLDIDTIVQDSLAFSLSDAEHKEVLKSVFGLRHKYISSVKSDPLFGLVRITGLNLNDLHYLDTKLSDYDIALAYNIDREDDERFVDMVFNVVMGMPSMKAALEHEGKRKKKLLGNTDSLKVVAMMWLQGAQYHEIAKKVGITVDQAIVIVMFLQGAIHDKAVGVMTFMQHSKGLDNIAAILWPEYLRLGINKRAMFDLYREKIPERIQLHAIVHFFDATGGNCEMDGSIKHTIVNHHQDICNYMSVQGYPEITIDSLLDVIKYMNR